MSPDPILAEYMGGEPNGGVYNSMNLGLMSYAAQNPVRYVDPDGNNPVAGAIIGGIASSIFYVGKCLYTNKELTMKGIDEAFGAGATIGFAAGMLPVEAVLVAGAGLFGFSTGDLINRGMEYNNLDESGKKEFQVDAAITAASGMMLFTAGAKTSVDADGAMTHSTAKSTAGEPFPVGTNKQSLVGIDPKTLKPTKRGPLDQQTLKFLRNNPKKFESVVTDKKGNVGDGHHKREIAIEEGRSVDVDVRPYNYE